MLALSLLVTFLFALGAAVARVSAQPHERTVTEPETVMDVASAAESRKSGRTSGSVPVTVPARYRGRTASYWAGRYRHRTRQLQNARRTARQIINAPSYGKTSLENAFLCIHGYEGPWKIHNPPYDGGLQMDKDFQRTYGSWALAAFGPAGNWPISVQIAVAIRAYTSGRGFHPWPKTARYCGLLP